MTQKSKRSREIAKHFQKERFYSLEEAIEVLKNCPSLKFDQSVDVALKTGVDMRKSDQQIRGVVSLPHGTGRNVVLVVFAKGDKAKEALNAGAQYVGGEELIEKVKSGWIGFDGVIATPEMMKGVGTLGKILGPRGLMPTPKAGTVTLDVAKAVTEVKGGKIEFKGDKNGVINTIVGKLSFEKDKIRDNVRAFIEAIVRAKPHSAKGEYLRTLYLTSTMGPGLRVDLGSVCGLQGAES
jgi:large subunit ribosomal protein L1